MNFPTESWGPHPCSDSEKKLNLSLCVYVLAKQNRKRKFSVVFIQVVKKSALHVRNLLFFYLLIELVSFDVLVAVAVSVAASPAVARSSLLPGFVDVRKRLGIRTSFW